MLRAVGSGSPGAQVAYASRAEPQGPYRAYSDWPSTLLDTTFKVGQNYVPPRLVSVREAGINGTGKVRPLFIADLFAMKWAAIESVMTSTGM